LTAAHAVSQKPTYSNQINPLSLIIPIKSTIFNPKPTYSNQINWAPPLAMPGQWRTVLKDKKAEKIL
jgi:hypothetical protein